MFDSELQLKDKYIWKYFIAYDGIQTMDLWYWKWLLCQLRHNHGSKLKDAAWGLELSWFRQMGTGTLQSHKKLLTIEREESKHEN